MNLEKETLDTLKQRLNDQIEALDRSAIVAITDAQGVITYVNPMFCKLSEYNEKELVGQTHRLINSGHHDRAFFVNMWRTIGMGKVWRGEVCNRAKSGKLYWVDTTIVPFTNDTEKIEQYIAIRYDITDKKETETVLEDERKRLVESEKMASIGVMAAGIAHELGNPLGAIRGRLEMLQSMLQQPDFQKEFALQSVEKMIQGVDRMTKIIRGLKNYSRDGSNDEKQKFDLSQLIGDILEVSSEKCRKHQIEVRTNGLDEAFNINGRETEIGQVVVNLLNNAIDAIKNDEKAWIEFHLHRDDEMATLCVSDSGKGVPEDIRSKIFDPFYTTKEVGQGTGLGLSICKNIATKHGGDLFYSDEGGVSHFCLKLPV